MKCTINKAQVKMRIKDAWKAGLWRLSEEILEDCNEYCKRSPDHTMRDSSLAQSKPQDGILVWETAYARRQYWEIQTALTPGTTWKWCETAKRNHKQQWEEQAKRGFLANL